MADTALENATPDLLQILAPDGTVIDAANDPRLSPETALAIYKTMLRTRALDERGMNLQRQGRIHFYLACSGQEAASVASTAAMTADDWILPSYRQPGSALYRQVAMRDMINQLFGNVKDTTKGRQMPVHYSFKDHHFVSISSPIGTQIVQAAGVAYAMKLRKKATAALTFMGDGGTSSNDFHTGLNFAAVWKAPVVFLCENNQWAISVPYAKQTASATIAEKAVAYGMPGIRVDGNDALAVYRATRDARARALRGEGPTLIEAVTFRMAGHSSSDDPRRYRPEAECEKWAKLCPVDRLRRYLEARGLWDDAKEEAAKREARDEVNEAVREAEKHPRPELETMFTDVYATMPKALKEQYDVERTARGEGRFP